MKKTQKRAFNPFLSRQVLRSSYMKSILKDQTDSPAQPLLHVARPISLTSIRRSYKKTQSVCVKGYYDFHEMHFNDLHNAKNHSAAGASPQTPF